MATYNSTAISTPRPIPGFGAGGGQEKTQYCEITVPSGATTSDVFNLFDLPPHARVMSLKYSTDALGAGTLNIGDTGTYLDDGTSVAALATRYISGGAITSAGVVTSASTAGIYFYTGKGLPANKNRLRVQATLATGPTTAAGTLRVNLSYTVEEPQLP